MTENQTPPPFNQVLRECCHAPKYVQNFDSTFDTTLSRLPPFVLYDLSTGAMETNLERLRFDLACFRDFVINATYLPILFTYYYPHIQSNYSFKIA